MFSTRNLCLSAVVALGLLAAAAQPAQAFIANGFFSGTIDDPAGSGFNINDTIYGFFLIDTDTPPDALTGDYLGGVFGLDAFVSDGGSTDTQVLFNETADVFTNDAEFDFFFGPPTGSLGDNFDVTLGSLSSPLGNDLQTNVNILIAEGPNAIDLFDFDALSGTIDNALTNGNLFFIPDYIEITPEPASLALLGLGGISLLRRR